MKTVCMTDRELTQGEIESIERFYSYTDGIGFACIEASVMVMMPDGMSNDPERMSSAAQSIMEQALCEHPDMETFHMDDGFYMVALPAGIFAISEEGCEGTLAQLLSLRGRCLGACERSEVIAVIFGKE